MIGLDWFVAKIVDICWLIRLTWSHSFELWLEDVHFAALSEIFRRLIRHLLYVRALHPGSLAYKLIKAVFKFKLLPILLSLVHNLHDF